VTNRSDTSIYSRAKLRASGGQAPDSDERSSYRSMAARPWADDLGMVIRRAHVRQTDQHRAAVIRLLGFDELVVRIGDRLEDVVAARNAGSATDRRRFFNQLLS